VDVVAVADGSVMDCERAAAEGKGDDDNEAVADDEDKEEDEGEDEEEDKAEDGVVDDEAFEEQGRAVEQSMHSRRCNAFGFKHCMPKKRNNAKANINVNGTIEAKIQNKLSCTNKWMQIVWIVL
jgi:hypothetical protein